VKSLEHELETLRASLKRTELAVAGNELRELNKRHATEGLARVQADVKELYRRGIVDANGKRVSPRLPKEMNGTDADVV
jgi:ribosomal protein S20